ncbi:hypothetical protein BpHYR1_032701 [Brachionus plicatilis]|uniref:Uncharacterized protein n=1 Tax=Brachionus plicatilis TaxID=10195 RepID=A0A3M7Q406_BRAPC|nr:hypothetical protein BpHYR1_032701 [Brachionus plicatilis]
MLNLKTKLVKSITKFLTTVKILKINDYLTWKCLEQDLNDPTSLFSIRTISSACITELERPHK